MTVVTQCNNTHHNYAQNGYTLHNKSQCSSTKFNDYQHNDTQHSDAQKSVNKYNNTWYKTLSYMRMSIITVQLHSLY